MIRTRTLAPLLLLLAALPAPAASQLILRDDVNGWGWLAMLTDRTAIVELAYVRPATGEQQQLDGELLSALEERGVRRIATNEGFDPTRSHVLVECAAVDWTDDAAGQVHFGLHAEVSYWDHTRLAATEIYESMLLGSIHRDAFTTGAYVDACTRSVSQVLLRLGYDRG
ncbi:MAG TPA: hypothetical protein VFQ22_13120 [Longimicrobiales bacterium]|nr:hypothetical protein [Longimicrobiales bacterium]